MKRFSFLLALFTLPISALAGPNCTNAYDATNFYDFKESCFKHDSCYSEAYLTGMSKKDCDERFYQHMKASCRGRSFLCDNAAETYFFAVKMLPNSEFTNAAQKSARILEEVATMPKKDQRALAQIFASRAYGQDLWTKKNTQCSRLSSDSQFKACRQDKNRIQVVDIPDQFHMGKCNILGVSWANGARTENAHIQAAKYRVPVNQITREGGKDPCETLY